MDGISIDELEVVSRLTIELTKIKLETCGHLCIENFASGCFGKLISEVVACKPIINIVCDDKL